MREETMDRLDDLLAAHFSVEPAPGELAERILSEARSAGPELPGLIGRIGITATESGISMISAGRLAPPSSARGRRLVEQAREELAGYLEGKRSFFTVSVDLSGLSEFQRDVLAAARSIPFGEVRSYAWVAGAIGSPRAVRAVGSALGRNPVPLIVPCHRVVRSDGSLGGYSFGLPIKDRLLALERAIPALVGCASTRIVCRRGCRHEQRIREDQRVVFATVRDARSVGYRPCRVCRPAG
jgi:O-6-methylguanine DNA methyltransferase